MDTCNTLSVNDTHNYLLFLQDLKKALPNITLTAAVGIQPFVGPDGTPETNLSGFAKVLDGVSA